MKLAKLLSVLGGIFAALGPWTPALSAVRVMEFHPPVVVVGANQSSNWSGYNQGTLEQGGKTFQQISGIWTVPTATQHKPHEAEYSATWVGIGGGCVDSSCQVTDSTLIQAGTEQDVNKAGKASYDAWWEIIPAPSVIISNFPVAAGNRIYVDISSPADGDWTITVKNLSTGKSWSQTTPYASSEDTAEWIEETPVVISNSGAVTIGPMPKLSRVHFDKAMTDSAGAGLKASEELQLVDPTTSAVLATPSSPDPEADGFNDCTYSKTCSAPTSS